MFSADVSVGAELDDGIVVDKWENLIVGVQPSKISIVLDANMVRFADSRGNITGLMGFDQSKQQQRSNSAYPDPNGDLVQPLSTFASLGGEIFVGGAKNVATSGQWTGEMQAFHGFGRPLSDGDMRCLYRTERARRD
jgi:hypothetical protein